MTPATLHYVHDPLCGWCYAAAPLVRIARDMLPVQAHGGGMLAGAARRRVTPEWRRMVMAHDQRIAQVSGQPFGPAYFDGLLCDTQAVLDSAPPITAMLAADDLAGAGLDLLARVQHAHYVEGRHIAEPATLQQLAVDLGLDAGDFQRAYRAFEGAATAQHIAQSRSLLSQVGGHGFPTVAIEAGGVWRRVDVGAYFGQPQAWRTALADWAGVAG